MRVRAWVSGCAAVESVRESGANCTCLICVYICPSKITKMP